MKELVVSFFLLLGMMCPRPVKPDWDLCMDRFIERTEVNQKIIVEACNCGNKVLRLSSMGAQSQEHSADLVWFDVGEPLGIGECVTRSAKVQNCYDYDLVYAWYSVMGANEPRAKVPVTLDKEGVLRVQ